MAGPNLGYLQWAQAELCMLPGATRAYGAVNGLRAVVWERLIIEPKAGVAITSLRVQDREELILPTPAALLGLGGLPGPLPPLLAQCKCVIELRNVSRHAIVAPMVGLIVRAVDDDDATHFFQGRVSLLMLTEYRRLRRAS